jgi:hypothetical protein
VVRRLVTAGVAVESAGPRRRLEDVFLRLVGEEVGVTDTARGRASRLGAGVRQDTEAR